jgi:hypothetical protein
VKTKRTYATKTNPCPVCNRDHKCSIGDDRSIFCGRTFTDSPGFKFMGKTACETWGMFRAADDPALGRRDEPRGPAADLSALDAKPWTSIFAQQEAAMTATLRGKLAAALKLPAWAVCGAGWIAGESCWTFPERDAGGRIIGINRRYRDGSKMVIGGGNRGLTILNGWDRAGTIFLPEGASDTLTLAAMGLSALGRPSNTGGVKLLAELLRGFHDRPVIVLGEHDAKPDGKWPGREGATSTAARLTAALGRPVAWALPANGSKDIRAWATANALDDSPESWAKLGETFAASLVPGEPETAKPEAKRPEASGEDIVLTCLADVEAKAVSWLWPSRIALGKMTTFAGDPGLGKSFITLDMAARVSTGAAWPDGSGNAPKGSVIIMGVEDDLADTIRPRLNAAGADVRKVHALEGVEVRAKGKDPFQRAITLEDIAKIRTAADRLPDCKLIVIDPVSCFLGESDSHKNAEIRALLAPLAKLAADKGLAAVIVSHLSKGSGPAMYRTMGSIAFVAAARAAFLACKDRDDATDNRRLFLPVKNNIGNDKTGLAYRFAGEREQTRIEWEPEPVTTTADEATAEQRPGGGDRQGKRRERKEEEAGTRLLIALDRLADPTTGWAMLGRVRDAAGLTHAWAKRAVFLLSGNENESDNRIEVGEGDTPMPKNGVRKDEAIRRLRPGQKTASPTTPTDIFE